RNVYDSGMRQTELHLTEPERRALTAFRRKGVHPAREVNRAHVLMALDQGGSDYAMHDEPRPGQPRKYQTSQEAEVVALACSAPPGGRKRWTIRLLTAAARACPGLANVNRETVRQMLKKTTASPGAN